MKKNSSPWLRQLNKDRIQTKLQHDLEIDVAIVGAGIAGISTAFYVLKHTNLKVSVFEGHKLAHGATGHNAGQIVSYFERGFASLVNEFGLGLAAEGQQGVEDAWGLLDEMYTTAGLTIPFSRFIGHAGLSSEVQVLWHLENNRMRKEAKLNTEQIRISKSAEFSSRIPAQYAGLYSLVSHTEINTALETEAPGFVAVLSYQKGCINSALFCQEVVTFLLQKYPERFALYEHTPIRKIVLHTKYALLDADKATVRAGRVVLCTNGFENFHILNKTGLDIDARYHHQVSGKVGYMSGYLETLNKTPIAISYLTDPAAGPENSYYYLTRRPYEHEKGSVHNLISVGGPDVDLEEYANYSHESEFPDAMQDEIDRFVKKFYDTDPNKKIEYVFTWHGLMGYTKNGVRMIGPEPQNPVLLYNLGCNGIGILPSLYGGRRLASFLAGEQVPPSIFDIPARSETKKN